jgi:hypothetical protein
VNARWLGREHVEEALRELSDESLQRELWPSAASPTSFDECVAQLIDDSSLGVALDRGLAFDETTDAVLCRLRVALQQVGWNRPPKDVLDDPRMTEVRLLAANSLARLTDSG